MIDRKEDSYLFKHGFFDENVMALKIDGKEEYAFLVNENRFDGELNSKEKVLKFLSNRYLNVISNSLPNSNETNTVYKTKEQIKSEDDQQSNYVAVFILLIIIFSVIMTCSSYNTK